MKNRNWFWGFFFLLSAIFVIASQPGAFGHVGFLSILATVLLAALFIESLIKLNFFGTFIPLAFLYIIYWEPLDLVYISPWLLIFAAILASIGFSILFGRHPEKPIHFHGGNDCFKKSNESTDDNNPYAKVKFGASSKYLHSDCLKSGQFTVSFGALEVFFDQAQLSSEGAEIFIDCSFGAVKLYVPRHWRVKDNIQASLGGMDNNSRSSQASENSPVLTITGSVQFGGIEIHYV
ncbi:MAG: hypothetical protein ABRQ25_11825 [Clostridiaceae bacterium]